MSLILSLSITLGPAASSWARHGLVQGTDLYLDRHKPTYIGGELEHFNAYVFPHWNLLTPALRTGEPQSGARATGHYSALYADPAALETLAKGMTGGTLPVARALAAKFPWQDYKTVIDIGTAQGGLPVDLLPAEGLLEIQLGEEHFAWTVK